MPIADIHPYDQLTVADVRYAGSRRWTLHPEDVLPLWIADMDFPTAPAIVEAVTARLREPLVYHHGETAPELKAALSQKLARDTGLTDLTPEGIQFMPGVVCGLYWAVASLSQPGDEVLTFTPVYPPFHQAIVAQGRKISAIPLIEPTDAVERWEIDWNLLEQKVKPGQLLMLCHPHNPTGRVWDAEELERLRSLVIRHRLWVVCDELHADLTYAPETFRAFAADPAVREQTLTLTGPCKAFNTPAMGIGAAITHSEEIRQRFHQASFGLLGHAGVLNYVMWEAALRDGEAWLRDTMAYLKQNQTLLQRYVERHWPWARVWPGEATYLAWLDFRAHPRAQEMHQFLIREARVALQDGTDFAPKELADRYQGFMRLNYATPRPILEEALERMNHAFEQAGKPA